MKSIRATRRRDFHVYSRLPVPRLDAQTLDVASYKQAMSGLLAAFADARFSVDDVIAEEDLVAVRHRFHGIHNAKFQGVPASGEPVEISGIAIFRLKE